jgi:hypothetical protein
MLWKVIPETTGEVIAGTNKMSRDEKKQWKCETGLNLFKIF